MVMLRPKDATGMANSVDPDQTAPCWNSQIWFRTVYSDQTVQIFRIITALRIYNVIRHTVTSSDNMIHHVSFCVS